MESKESFKVSIVGCGNVGATMAYAMVLDGTPTDLALIDIDADRANGLLLDLDHSLSFTPYTKLESSDDMAICKGSKLVVVTAGARQREGETRLDLIAKNRAIFETIIPKIAKAAPDTLLLIVSNPVDVLTLEALKLSGFPKSRVFGSGTLLDTARFQFHISEKLDVHPSSVNAFILGEHGDSSFPVYSSADIAGAPLRDMPEFTKEIEKECYEDTKNAAYRIIHDQGYTCYSISTAVLQIMKAIFEDSNEVFPLSTLLEDYYGHSDVALSLPCVLGRKGIERQILTPLDEKEKELLKNSVDTLKGYQ
ncbi:L-lactate dehydrogenase [Candidatus Peregrinibacteria bacterium]|nr:L-lactate dehydrogenase [Candidatus Peregrinibacteria bacterium]